MGRKLAGVGVAAEAATGTVVGSVVSVVRAGSESEEEVAEVPLAIFDDYGGGSPFVS